MYLFVHSFSFKGKEHFYIEIICDLASPSQYTPLPLSSAHLAPAIGILAVHQTLNVHDCLGASILTLLTTLLVSLQNATWAVPSST